MINKSLKVFLLLVFVSFPFFSQASIEPDWVCGTSYKTSVKTVKELSNLCQDSYVGGSLAATKPKEVKNKIGGTFFEWECSNSVAKEKCFAYKQVDGVCNPAGREIHYVTSDPSKSKLCNAGTPSPVYEALEEYVWSCYGENGGKLANCINYKARNPQCGRLSNKGVGGIEGVGGAIGNKYYLDLFEKIVANEKDYFLKYLTYEPFSEKDLEIKKEREMFCEIGYPVFTNLENWKKGKITWNCREFDNKKYIAGTISCEVSLNINGKCTSDFNDLGTNSENICKEGFAEYLFKANDYHYWRCLGSLGSDICKTVIAKDGKVNGVCGTNNKKSFTTLPIASTYQTLCTAGTDTAISEDATKWSWGCAGANGGTNDSCSANKISGVVNGVCGSSNGGTFASEPTTNLCSSGIATSISGITGKWSWSCTGFNKGTDSSCSANKTTALSVACGPDNGKKITKFNKATACSNGKLSGYGSYGAKGPWVWVCASYDQKSRVSCKSI